MVIYKLTSPSGKVYIGKTKYLEARVKDHKRQARLNRPGPLYRAIRLYGWDSFLLEVIDEALTPEELSKKEKKWIEHFGSFGEAGYNCTPGGEGGGWVKGQTFSEEHRRKISEGLKGRKYSPETLEKMRTSHLGQESAWKGQKASPELREKLRKAHLGKTHSDETKKKMAKSRTGSSRSEETKNRMSIAQKERWKNRKVRLP